MPNIKQISNSGELYDILAVSASSALIATYDVSGRNIATLLDNASTGVGAGLKIENNIISINTNGTANSAQSAFAEGVSTSAEGIASHAEGNQSIASGIAAHAEGTNTSAIDNFSHAEGAGTIASSYAHAEGIGTSAIGYGSHTEGAGTIANGDYSHAAGYKTSAILSASFAEGSYTYVNAFNSHVGGLSSRIDMGETTFAFGEGLRVGQLSPLTVFGTYNNEGYATQGSAKFVIGNGISNEDRSDALVVYYNGDVETTGTISAYNYVGRYNGYTPAQYTIVAAAQNGGTKDANTITPAKNTNISGRSVIYPISAATTGKNYPEAGRISLRCTSNFTNNQYDVVESLGSKNFVRRRSNAGTWTGWNYCVESPVGSGIYKIQTGSGTEANVLYIL